MSTDKSLFVCEMFIIKIRDFQISIGLFSVGFIIVLHVLPIIIIHLSTREDRDRYEINVEIPFL